MNPLTRLRVRLNRFRLDDQLAHGADPASSPALGLRAAQLLRERATLADGLERLAEAARRPAPGFSVRVPLRRAQILDCAAEIEALAGRLREAQPADVRGIAMTAQLLHDGASPLYTEAATSLRYALRSARLALDPIGDSFAGVPVAA